jgi:hypothetical protein
MLACRHLQACIMGFGLVCMHPYMLQPSQHLLNCCPAPSPPQVKRVLRAEGTLLRGLALDPEGAYVAAAGSDGSLWLWETADGSQAHRGRGTAAKVRALWRGLSCWRRGLPPHMQTGRCKEGRSLLLGFVAAGYA